MNRLADEIPVTGLYTQREQQAAVHTLHRAQSPLNRIIHNKRKSNNRLINSGAKTKSKWQGSNCRKNVKFSFKIGRETLHCDARIKRYQVRQRSYLWNHTHLRSTQRPQGTNPPPLRPPPPLAMPGPLWKTLPSCYYYYYSSPPAIRKTRSCTINKMQYCRHLLQ